MSDNSFCGWMIVEIMGHRRLGGYVTEQEIAGSVFLRVDVPGEAEGLSVTQFYSPAAIYAMTPTTEELARLVARSNQPEPVHRWELPELPEGRAGTPADVNPHYRDDEEMEEEEEELPYNRIPF